jgi:UDP-glucose 4-epimerase
MRTILITGGAGFIGSHLAAEALACGDRVLVLDSLVTGHRDNVPAGAEFLHRDLRDPGLGELLRRERVDTVSHHAAQANVRVSVEQPLADAQANVLGGLALIEACRFAGVRRVLFASSGGTVYGHQDAFPCDEDQPLRPLSPYGCSKLAIESYLGAYARLGDLDPVILRYANVYGPRQDPHGEAGIIAILCEKFLAGEPPKIFGDGSQTRDYVHVGDIAAIQRAVFDNWQPGIYNVGTGIETSLNEIWSRIAGMLGHEIAAQRLPANAAELARNSLNAHRLRSTFAFAPWKSLAEALPPTVEWYRQRAARAHTTVIA